MSITLVSKPKLYCPAHFEVPFHLSATDLGTPPARIDIGLYMADESNTRLHPLNKKIKPRATGVSYRKDFRSVCEKTVETSFPNDSASVQIDASISKRVKLFYGPVTFNSTTCETVINQVTTESSIINLINANVNSDTHSLFGDSSGFTGGRTGLLLSQRPLIWKLQHGSKDYLWFLGAGSIQIKYYKNNTQTGSTQTFTLTGATTVKYVSLDYSQYSISTKPDYATVYVVDGIGDGTLYTIKYCPCSETDDYLGILFLEPLGGRSMFATGIPQESSIERKATTIYKTMDLSQTDHKTGHNSILLPSGSRKLTFQTDVEQATGDRKWIENFMSASGYHLQKGYGSTLRWEKFILDPSSFKVKERNKILEVSFSGFCSESINSQSIDI